MAKTKKADEGQIVVTEIMEGFLDLVLVGRTPLIINKLSKKVREELLCPPPKKNAAARAASLKHDPVAEFRASIHRIADVTAPTLLALPAAAPKRAMASAALDMTGVKKAQIGRLSYVSGEYVPVFGTPQLFISPVRNSDIQRTPDMRTRCIVPEWICKLKINFVVPLLNPTTIVNLLSAAGLYIGVGDWRSEKGAGSFGQFRVMPWAQAEQDEAVQKICSQGRAIQEERMQNPIPYDDETAELLRFFEEQIETRGRRALLATA